MKHQRRKRGGSLMIPPPNKIRQRWKLYDADIVTQLQHQEISERQARREQSKRNWRRYALRKEKHGEYPEVNHSTREGSGL